jgi:hypothetical protein
VTRIGATPSIASCFEPTKTRSTAVYVAALPGGFASCFAWNRRRLIRSLRAAQSVSRALGDALEPGQALRLAAPQVRPAAV